MRMFAKDPAHSALHLLILISFLALAAARTVVAEAVPGQVRGHVVGPDGKPLPGVRVELTNDLTGYRQGATTDLNGRFLLFNVPPNPYHLAASIPGFAPYHADLTVRSSVPVEREVRLALEVAATEQVTAAAEPAALETDTSATHTDIDQSLIRRTPLGGPGRSFEQLVMSAPGFSSDENGRYHFQGGHSQQLVVLDGQPIGDQIGLTFSNSIDAGVAQDIEIVTGGIPAEYGEKANGVINMTTRSGLGWNRTNGEVTLALASFSTLGGSAWAGGGDSRFGWFVDADGMKSDRFLDPVSFDNFHNEGNIVRGFLRLDGVSTDQASSWRLSGNIGRTDRDVTNLPSQELAGQADTVATKDYNVNLGWQRVFSSGLVLAGQVYARGNRFTLSPSPGDTPVTASSNRTLTNQGINVAVSETFGVNELKAGIQAKRFPISEQFSFLVTDPSYNDPSSDGYNPNLAPYDGTRGGSPFYFSGSDTGAYVAAFLEDTIRWNDLTASVGLRYDYNHLFIAEHQLAPRIGVAYYFKPTETVFRASYNRMFITPEYENILLSSSPQAASITPPDVQDSQSLGGGQLYNVSERHDVWNVGVQQGIGSSLRLDVSYWYRNVRNAADQDQFFNTGIVFPLNFATGHLHGWDVRLDLAPVFGGLSGYASVGHVYAQYCNPFVGGLFLTSDALDTLQGGCFIIDHDQNIQEQVGLFYDVGKTGVWAGMTQRYDSGLVTDAGTLQDVLSSPDTAYAAPYIRYDEDPQRVTSRTIWSFSVGARLERYGLPLELQIDLLNAFNAMGLYNFQSIFGGTHVVPPRKVAGRLSVVF